MTPNAEQFEAINSTAEQIICLAGPGSGKSSTLVARIQRMVADGVNPKTIVAISYTTAAAVILQSRLKMPLGFCGTLHSFMLRLLEQHGSRINLPSKLVVLDDDGRQRLIDQIVRDFKVRDSKESLETALKDSRYDSPRSGTLLSKTALAAVEYHRRCRTAGLIDFDAILRHGLRLVQSMRPEEFPFRHLLADEIQDASNEDMAIYLNMPVATRFFVGDDSQSIFGFRGGNVNGMLQLTTNPDWQVLKLETNFRCPSVICHAANRLISHNTNRFDKKTISSKKGGTITIYSHAQPNFEYVAILKHITTILSVEQSVEQSIAVLCRTNRLANDIRTFLRGSGLQVNERRQPDLPADWVKAKLFLAFAGSLASDHAALAYLEACHGPTHAKHTRRQAALACQSVNDFYFHFADTPAAIQAFSSQGFSHEARELVQAASRRLSSLGEWSVSDLLIELNRAGEIEEEQRGGITVTTCHAAKGREFQHVIIAGCEEEFWIGKDDSEEEIAEARRLMYVAMTRAESTLTMTWCRSRPQWRGANAAPGPVESRTPLRFLVEI